VVVAPPVWGCVWEASISRAAPATITAAIIANRAAGLDMLVFMPCPVINVADESYTWLTPRLPYGAGGRGGVGGESALWANVNMWVRTVLLLGKRDSSYYGGDVFCRAGLLNLSGPLGCNRRRLRRRS